MNLKSIAFAFSFFLTLGVIANAHPKDETTIYAFGYASCLGDTTCYISTIQVLDSASVNSKTKMLGNRAEYAHQMEMALRKIDGKHYTCALFFNTNKGKLEKKYLSIRKRCERDGSLRLESLPEQDFQFAPISSPHE